MLPFTETVIVSPRLQISTRIERGKVDDPLKSLELLVWLKVNDRAEVTTNPIVTMLLNYFRYGHPGGISDIDPKSIVSSMPVEHYEVLPIEAGYIQLLSEGKISGGRFSEYMIKEKIRFPAGIAAKFLLLKGVPIPDGYPYNNEVISEETGKSVIWGGLKQ